MKKEACILRCDKITKEYKSNGSLFGNSSKFTALNEVSLYIGEGETLGIVGESGSGKSTLGEIMGDIQRPTKGRVFFGDRDIRLLSRAEYMEYRKSVQFIFQDPKGSMNSYHRIRRVLREPLRALGIPGDETEFESLMASTLKKVGLCTDVLNKYPGELSGGECQRVACARAIIVNPRIIICDEAVSSLDVSVQAQMLNLLKDIQAELGMSYMFISHDIGVVNYMADRIAVMDKGRIVETGGADDVFTSPVTGYTKRLIEDSFVNM